MHSVFKIYIFLCMVAQTTFAMEPVGYTEEERQKKNIIDMCDAAESGRINLVKACLQEGTPIDAHRLGWPALYFCLRRQHLEIAQLLWANGANVDATYRYGRTVLEELIHDLDLPTDQGYKNGLREGIRWLIGNGADLEKTDRMGYTPFRAAICIADLHTAIILRNAGVNILSSNIFESPLFSTMYNLKPVIVQYLLWEEPTNKELKKSYCNMLCELQSCIEESCNKYQQINTVIQLLESSKLPQIPQEARTIFMQEATKGKNIALLLRERQIGKR